MNQFPELPALLILDVQNGFDDPFWGERNNHNAEENMTRLQKEWRKRKGHIIYTKHLSLLPDSPLNYKNKNGTEFKPLVRPLPDEIVYTKSVNSAFIGTELETYLKANGIASVVITGLSTQHCVSTTVRMSANLGYQTFLVEDAIAAFGITDHKGVYHDAESIQEHELAMLQKEFAAITATDEILSKLSGLKA